jgi:uncharacterized coiled-coil DUF342 family protein
MTDVTAEIRATAGDGAVLKSVQQRYEDLCRLRDGAKKKAEDLQKKLDKANEKAEAARREAMQISDQITEVRGGAEAWLSLKREIAQLANVITNLKRAGASG